VRIERGAIRYELMNCFHGRIICRPPPPHDSKFRTQSYLAAHEREC
jgi:hypothetical protein